MSGELKDDMESFYARVCELRAKISADMSFSIGQLRDMNRLTEIVRVMMLEQRRDEE